MAMPAFTVGLVIAVLVILLSILGALGIVQPTPVVVFGLLGALGVARIV